MSRIDYSVWDHIEVSDDEDETHPNIDTPSLFRWRHQVIHYFGINLCYLLKKNNHNNNEAVMVVLFCRQHSCEKLILKYFDICCTLILLDRTVVDMESLFL